ncbi:MAG TPA: polysaccharide biosynthesis tyrosine autokinase, partial [Thermoanaerobaculia bacterium]|nr:polysaccharide biosynthesis tyrosine autokinase [Thermoanaerobaculia bacterium]
MSNQNEAPYEFRADEPQQDVHLAHYWAVILKHQRLILVSIGIALLVGLLISVLSERSYRATAVLNVEKDTASLLEIGTQRPFSAQDPEFLPTQTRLMKSRGVAERVLARLEPEAASEVSAAEIQANLEANPIRGTSLIELSYIGDSPEQAAQIANLTADEYIQWNIESKLQAVDQTSSFIATQIAQLKNEIDAKELELQAYGREKGIISDNPQTNVTLQNLESLNTDYSAAVADRVAKEARFRELQNASPDAIADTLSDGETAQLRTEQARLEREYAEKLNLYKPEWPAMQQLKAQIDKGSQHLWTFTRETAARAREVARSEYLTARRREDSLRAVMQGQKGEAMALNSDAVQYNTLAVEVKTKRALHDKLLEQQAETEVTSRLRGQGVSNVRVVDDALPPGARFRPSYSRNALNALLFGAAIGLGLAFLREYLDRSLRSPEQVEQYLQLPALGVIPAVGAPSHRRYGYSYLLKKRRKPFQDDGENEEKQSVELLPHEHPRTTAAEAYRAFRTALLLSRAGGVKSIVITSSVPAEGKTSTALNLSIVLGQLGKNVLLIDADLHKPRTHEVLRISNRAGLVTILAENARPADVTVKTSFPGLSVIPAGPLSPNPSGLLASDAMADLLKSSASNYDFVVIDTPPISMVSDAILLGYRADGAVLCVKGGDTPREQVARVRDKMLRSNVRILGVLINNLEDDPTAYGGRYYHYYSEQG